MKHKYGYFDKKQIDEYKKKLHNKMFWLLLYRDPKTINKYPEMNDENLKKYFDFLMKEIDGFNEILFYPKEIVEILSLLTSAKNELFEEEFNYQNYRKLILDAHHLIDEIKEAD